MLDPVSLRELVPDFEAKGAPVATKVTRGPRLLPDRRRQDRPADRAPAPAEPRQLRDQPEPAREVAGCRRPRRGASTFSPASRAPSALRRRPRGRACAPATRASTSTGNKKSNFEPGVDLRAKVTILAEGARGSLTKELVPRLKLDEGKFPMVYSIGVKELWEVPKGRLPRGAVIHTMGYPLDARTFGGGFVYGFTDERISVGLVVGLDYHDPFLDPHALFQKFKEHPLLKEMLAGGKMVRYGARTISEGGWYSIPRPYADGVLLVGEAAGYLNAMRLKGIHLAIKTGMLAAESGPRRGRRGRRLGRAARVVRGQGRSVLRQERALEGPQLPPGLQARPVGRALPQRPADVHGRPRPRRSDGAVEGLRGDREARRVLRPAGDARRLPAARRWTASSPSTA